MIRLLLILLFLTGCSYDPYHYYYDCEGTNRSGYPREDTFYLHDKIVIDDMEYPHELVSETSQSKKYVYYYKFMDELSWRYEIRINKVNNSIQDIAFDQKDNIIGDNDFECTVTKTLFPL